MRPKHDLIKLYRHVLRAGDVRLARRLGRILVRDPHYRERALAELEPFPREHTAYITPGGQLLDRMLQRLDPLGDT